MGYTKISASKITRYTVLITPTVMLRFPNQSLPMRFGPLPSTTYKAGPSSTAGTVLAIPVFTSLNEETRK